MSLIRKKITSFSDEGLMTLLSSKRKNEALTELHARYSKNVLGFFVRMFNGDSDKAQDFVQDLFMRILEKHHQFKLDKKFSSWMYTIASNMCKTSFRRLPTKELPLEEIGAIDNWDDNSLDKTRFNDSLKDAISDLEEHHRLAFVLRYMEEKSIKEIAEITTTAEGTVKSRLYYATKKVARSLEVFKTEVETQSFKMN